MKHLHKLLFLALLFISFKGYSQCAINTSAITNPTCYGMCDGTAQAVATGNPPFIFVINNGATIDSTTGFAFNLCAGSYVITATDGSGCVTTTNVVIAQPPLLISSLVSTTNAGCLPGCNGTATIITNGGVAPYSYNITGTSIGTQTQTNPNFNNLCAGTYTILTMDAMGCTNYTTVLINNSTAPTISIVSSTPASCSPGCDGTVTMLSNSLINYSIFPLGGTTISSGNQATGLCANTLYTIVGVDANGCSATTTINFNNITPNIVSIISSIPPSCNFGCDGSVTLSSNVPMVFSAIPSAGTSVASNVISGLCSGINYLIVGTDANGCSTIVSTTLQSNTFIPVITTGLGSITASAPSQPSPILYSLNGSPFSSNNTFNGLCTGGYTLQVQDANGCVATSYPSVVSDTAFAGVVMNTIITDATCANSNNGSVDFIFAPASTHYFCPFGWSNCGITTSYHDQLSPNTYGLDIIDSATNYCVTKLWTINNLGTNCGDIEGTVYLDSNSNCIDDANELLLNNIPIQLSTGQFTYTNFLGEYSFNGLAYNNYSISQPNSWWWNNFYTNSCGNNFSVALNSTTPIITQNFADTSTAVLNNSILASASFYVPGLTTSLYIIHQGTSPAILSNGIITMVLDANLIYQNAFPTPNYVSSTGDTLKWNYNNFTTYQTYQVNVTTNTIATIGMPIANCVYDNVISGTDVYLLNNTSCTNGVVWTSFDPNNKVVSPAGTQPIGGILKQDSVLSYTINFQNTGTYLAHKVVLIDTLSDKVELTKFRVIHFSHPYEIEVIDNHILKFIFNQIMLPDSNSNEPASHGHISYQIMQKNSNQLGDVIKNKAYIYFDYNTPVITNETVNTIVAPSAVLNSIINENGLSIYPNPAKNKIQIKCKNPNSNKELYNSIGQLLLTTKENEINVSTFSNGIYLIKTADGNVQRFVIQK